MNFLQLIEIDWLKYLVPALGFLTMGFAESKEKEDEEEEETEEEEEEEQEEDEKDKKTYDQKYTTGLREEAKKNRVRYQDAEAKLKKIEDDKLKADGEHEKRADQIKADAEKDKLLFVKRIKLSELKAWGSKNGIIDVDLVQMVKLDDLVLDDDYSPTNLDEVMDDFKEKHPKLFDDNEDDDDRDPEDNKKPGRKNKELNLDKMSSEELLKSHYSGDRDKRKKRRNN